MIQIRPMEVRDRGCGVTTAVIFEVSSSTALSVEVADEDAAPIRAALLKSGANPSLFEVWSMSNAFHDCQMTEVDVELRDDMSFFSLVFVSGSLIWRTPTDPTDALLIGLRFGLPFFMPEPSGPIRLPLLLKAPYAIPGARTTWCERHAYSAGTCGGFTC